MGSNIVHEYFKKETADGIIYLKYDPIQLKGTELFIDKKGKQEKSQLVFENDITTDLLKDGFVSCSPLEFNLYSG